MSFPSKQNRFESEGTWRRQDECTFEPLDGVHQTFTVRQDVLEKS